MLKMTRYLAVALLLLAHPAFSSEQEQFIAPDNVRSVNYRLSVGEDAGMTLEVGGKKYQVTSAFSTTSPQKWNRFGGSDLGWTPDARRVGAGVYVISANDEKYKLERMISQRSYYLTVKDRFTNLTSDVIGIRLRNTIVPPAGDSRLLIGGLTPQEWSDHGLGLSGAMNFEYSGPSRPFVQASATDTSSLGMVAADDVFMAQNQFFHENGTVGVSDNNFGLAPGASYTIEWELYPLEKGDHYSFVNRMRRNWKTASLIDGPFGFIRTVDEWTDDQIRDWVTKTGISIGCYVVPADSWKTEAFGSSYFTQAEKNKANIKRSIDRLRSVVPELRTTLYYDCYPDISADAQTKYADSAIILKDGKRKVWIHPGQNIQVPYFYPTLTNTFGQMQQELINELLNDCHNNGLYWDEMSFSTIAAYTYGVRDWDGYSVEIDPETHEVTRKITNVYLITQPFIEKIVNDFKSRGIVMYGNQPAMTKTSIQWGIPRFVEYNTKYTATLTHLATPLALGLAGSEDYPLGDLKTPMIKMVHGLLDLGMLYIYHVGAYSEYHSDIVKHIYPITPLEVHAGYIIGKEKTITNRSGAYGWRDKTFNGETLIYDADGKLTDRKGITVTRDGAAFVKVELNPGEVAVIMNF